MTELRCRRDRILSLLQDRHGEWVSLYEIHAAMEEQEGRPLSHTGTSAKLRDLRKDKYGAWPVESQRKPGAEQTWVYRLK